MENQTVLEMPIDSTDLEPVPDPEQAVDRILQLIRHKLKEKKVTQVSIQERWKWKGSYVSQVLNKSKHLRLRDFLMILHVMDVRPQTFLAEIYPPEPETTKKLMESEKNMARVKETLSDLGSHLEQLFKSQLTSDQP